MAAVRTGVGGTSDAHRAERLRDVSTTERTLGVWLPEERRAPHPLICCAVDGLGPLGYEFLDGEWPGPAVRRVRRLVASMTLRARRPLLAFVRLDGAPRPLVLVRRGLREHGTAGIAAVVAQAIVTADELWAPPELELAHPFEDGWPGETLDALAEGAVGGALGAPRLQRIALGGCCLASPGALLGALERCRLPQLAPGLSVVEHDEGVLLGEVQLERRREPAPLRSPMISVPAGRVGLVRGARLRCRPAPATPCAAGERPRILVSNIPEFGRLELRIDGRPLDGYLASQTDSVTDAVRWVRETDGRTPLGLQIATGELLDLADSAFDALWEPPLYDAPTLGLRAVSIGHVLAVALAELDPDEETPDRALFRAALGWQEEDWEVALEHWREALGHGDQMAHFAIGYSLMELDRAAEAKEPLRRYSRLNENNSWAWVWLGHACWALGDHEGAESAYREAIERTARGSFETHAPELLARVRRREPWLGLYATGE